MKYLVIILFLFSCSVKDNCIPIEVHISDSTRICKFQSDSISYINDKVILIQKYDSIKRVSDTLRSNLFLANYKAEKAKFYLKICERNKTQERFLRGWMRRVFE